MRIFSKIFNRGYYQIMSIGIILFLCISVINGQDLSQLYKELDSSNHTLSALEIQADAIKQSAEQYVWIPDPELSLGVFPSPVETRLGSQIARVSGMQMIPNKGITTQKRKLTQMSALPVIEQRNVQELGLRKMLKTEWLNLYFLIHKSRILQENIHLLESREKLALKKVERNQSSLSDVVLIQLKKEELQQLILNLEYEKEYPINAISSLISRSFMEAEIDTQHFSFPEMPFLKESIEKSVFMNHPYFREMDALINVNNESTMLSEIQEKPVFGVGLDYIYIHPRGDIDPNWNGRDVIQLKANVRIPINKKDYQAKAKTNLIKNEALENRKLNFEQQILKTINDSFNQYELALSNFNFYSNQINILRSAIGLLESEYSSDSAKLEKLIDLEMRVSEYNINILNAKVKALKAINNLENLSLN